MRSVLEVLRRDHEEVQQMLSELESGPTAATAASADQLALRKKMAETLIIEESRLEAAEEMYFWPTVRDRLPDGDRLAHQAIGQEQEGKEVLAKLDKVDAGDPEFQVLLGAFLGSGPYHISLEETRVWPGLRATLTRADARQPAGKI